MSRRTYSLCSVNGSEKATAVERVTRTIFIDCRVPKVVQVHWSNISNNSETLKYDSVITLKEVDVYKMFALVMFRAAALASA